MKTKEVVYYVSVKRYPAGQTNILLSSNQEGKFTYGLDLASLPKEGTGEYSNGFRNFRSTIREILGVAGLSLGDEVEYRVFYNREYKSGGLFKKITPIVTPLRGFRNFARVVVI